MKRKLFQKQVSLILITIMVLMPVTLSLVGCKNQSSDTKITLNEVAHSIFYAPQYVAIELGYFEEESLDVKLVTGFGADKTMTAVLSGIAN